MSAARYARAIEKPGRKPKELIAKLKSPKETPQENAAGLVAAGLGPNAALAWEYSAYPFGDVEQKVDLTATVNAVVDAAERVNAGDLGDQEALLTAQTIALNAIFVDLAYRSRKSKLMDNFEKYLRLALRAQTQCRATCETIALLKNPPVFAKQANIAGQQLVNNGTLQGSRAQALESSRNELLEGPDGERLDTGATSEGRGGHLALAAVAALDGATNTGRQGPLRAKRLQGRGETKSA